MSKKILLVLSSHDTLGNTGNRCGNWLEELAAPYWAFRDAGYSMELASPRGGPAPLDPTSLKDTWMTNAGRRFMADERTQAALQSTRRLAEVDESTLDAVFLVGGAATTWDFPHDRDIKRIVESLHASSRIIAGICHGVIGLISATDQFGGPLLKNRMVTAISNAEDNMMGLDKVVPALPEDLLRRARAVYMSNVPLTENVICDPPFFTGQNPASAPLLARKMIEHLQKAA